MRGREIERKMERDREREREREEEYVLKTIIWCQYYSYLRVEEGYGQCFIRPNGFFMKRGVWFCVIFCF